VYVYVCAFFLSIKKEVAIENDTMVKFSLSDRKSQKLHGAIYNLTLCINLRHSKRNMSCTRQDDLKLSNLTALMYIFPKHIKASYIIIHKYNWIQLCS
jgi:hypothetical protein